MLYRYLLVLSSSALAACGSVEVSTNESFPHELNPRTFFEGKICADGVVRDYSGQQIRHFNAEIIASWDSDGVGTLAEEFRFNDGIEYRTWTLAPLMEDEAVVAYSASATDVPQATRMEFSGNAIHMDYQLNYQTGVDDSGKPETLSLTMTDRMYQVAEGVVVNETMMSKVGIDVGQVLLVMRQVGEEHSCWMNEGV